MKQGSPFPLTEDIVARTSVLVGIRRPKIRVGPKLVERAEEVCSGANEVVRDYVVDDDLDGYEWRLDER